MDLGISERAAIVTGSSRGIGKAIAHVLAEEGVRVAYAQETRAILESLNERSKPLLKRKLWRSRQIRKI